MRHYTSATPNLPQTWNRYEYSRNNPLKYIDLDGKEAVVFVVAATNSIRDMSGAFGHVAIWVSSGNRSNGVSFGGDFAFRKDKGYGSFLRAYQASGRSVHAFRLKTTPEQDARMLRYIEQRPTPFTDFNILNNNCTTTTSDVLKAGGVIPARKPVYDGASGLTSVPNTYFTPEDLEGALDGGELSSIVESQWTAPAMQPSRYDLGGIGGLALQELLARMQALNGTWLYADAFGAQLEVTRK
jgi:hypothetical protein